MEPLLWVEGGLFYDNTLTEGMKYKLNGGWSWNSFFPWFFNFFKKIFFSRGDVCIYGEWGIIYRCMCVFSFEGFRFFGAQEQGNNPNRSIDQVMS